MKLKLMLTLVACLAASGVAQAQEAWKDYNKGIRWEKSLDDAQRRAAEEGKPILLHQLVGDMDKEGC